MTDLNKKIYERAIDKQRIEFSNVELAIGRARFEALRRLNPSQFADLHKRNLQGENFDKMIDDLIVDREKGKS